MTYKHGVYADEVATSVVSPVSVTTGLPVVIGTAPIHLASTREYVNKPFLARTYQEAVDKLGYSGDWGKYSICEMMKSQFQLYGVAPVVFINVLDPAKHKRSVADSAVNLATGVGKISQDGLLLETLVVKLMAAGQPMVKNTDYVAAFDESGSVVITVIDGGEIPVEQATLTVTYSHLDPTMVTSSDIIGGIDATTGAYSGLELVNRVFPLYRLVPGLILAPSWSHDATVAAVMKAKAANINGLFKAIALIDADSNDADLVGEVPEWKNENGCTDPLQFVFWPKVKFGGEVYHLSTMAAGVICKTDSVNDDIPFVSPSNKALRADGAVSAAGADVTLGPDQANFLNGEGIVTALNLMGGWKLWGNRTAGYPTTADVKDSFIPVRRMFNYVANNIVLQYFENCDSPISRRSIDSLVDSLNIWLNGLTARGALLGGRVEFRPEENPSSGLIDGKVHFHVFLTPPTPAEQLNYTMEFDVENLNALFA